MSEHLIQSETLIAIADAIRAKTGGTAKLTPAQMASTVFSLQLGIDTSDATAAAAQILSGYTAYAKGAKVTGTIATKTSSNLTASGATVTVPAGYYASQASKSVVSATQATPSIAVDSEGKITASATQAAGYVAEGTKSATKQLTTQAAKTITPSTAEQTAVEAGVYTTGAVKVAAIPSSFISASLFSKAEFGKVTQASTIGEITIYHGLGVVPTGFFIYLKTGSGYTSAHYRNYSGIFSGDGYGSSGSKYDGAYLRADTVSVTKDASKIKISGTFQAGTYYYVAFAE